jgi:geranylgeranyl pyrophosphate synthase
LIARGRDAQLAALDLTEIRTADAAASVCDRIASTGAVQTARERAMALVTSAKAELPAVSARQRAALELVADGVVERYA